MQVHLQMKKTGSWPTQRKISPMLSSLGDKVDTKPGMHKVLGVQWNVTQDKFHFGIGEVVHTMEVL